MYGSECWSVTQINRKLDGFHNSCLWRICGIFCPIRMINDDMYQKTKCDSLREEIKRHHLKWLGHILKMDSLHIPKVAFRWTPSGKKRQGSPRTTWWRTVTSQHKWCMYVFGVCAHYKVISTLETFTQCNIFILAVKLSLKKN